MPTSCDQSPLSFCASMYGNAFEGLIVYFETFKAMRSPADMPQFLILLALSKVQTNLNQDEVIIFGHANIDQPSKSSLTELQACLL